MNTKLKELYSAINHQIHGFYACAVLSVYALGWIAYNYNNPLLLFLLFLAVEIAGIHISIFVHRAWTHKAWKPTRILNLYGLFMYTIFFVASSLCFAAIHRKHHRYADTPQDPHSPYFMSFYQVVIKPMYKLDLSYIPDLLKDKDQLFFHKYYWQVNILVWTILCLLGPSYVAFWFAFLGAVNFKLRLINYTAHQHPSKKGASNSLPWAFFFLEGEAWHANHHESPSSWNFSRAWWQFDPGAWTIKLLVALRLGKLK
jgi:fatty-acid desaturase